MHDVAQFGKTKKSNILERLEKKLQEAEGDDEETPEEEGDDELEGLGGEESGEETLDDMSDEDLGGEEGGDDEEKDLEDIEDLDEVEEAEPNEIELTIEREEYNVDQNNAYSFYDYIIDRVFTDNAIDALNIEYANIPQEKRKVVSARALFDNAVKRLNIDNKSEQKKLESQLQDSEEEEL